MTKEPLQLCSEHELETAERLARLSGEATLERWLNASQSARYRAFGSAINANRQTGVHDPVVYFMRREYLIKIGTSTNLRHRASALTATVLATIPGGVVLETQLHKEFAALRERGEWFRPEEPLIGYINEIRKRQRSSPIS